jgi:hypothetical protein
MVPRGAFAGAVACRAILCSFPSELFIESRSIAKIYE